MAAVTSVPATAAVPRRCRSNCRKRRSRCGSILLGGVAVLVFLVILFRLEVFRPRRVGEIRVHYILVPFSRNPGLPGFLLVLLLSGVNTFCSALGLRPGLRIESRVIRINQREVRFAWHICALRYSTCCVVTWRAWCSCICRIHILWRLAHRGCGLRRLAHHTGNRRSFTLRSFVRGVIYIIIRIGFVHGIPPGIVRIFVYYNRRICGSCESWRFLPCVVRVVWCSERRYLYDARLQQVHACLSKCRTPPR